MNPHPRIRKTAKWAGAAATVSLAVAWAASGWGFASIANQRGDAIGLGEGLVWIQTVRRYSVGSPFDWGRFTHGTWRMRLWNWTLVRSPTGFFLHFPLWTIVLPVAAATLVIWRTDAMAHRRARLNLCPKCNYDRAGLAPAAKCPECGTPGLRPTGQ